MTVTATRNNRPNIASAPVATGKAPVVAPGAAIARDAYRPAAQPDTTVPGEKIRTGLAVAIGVLGPIPTAQQAITNLAPAVAHLPVLGPTARLAERGLAALEAVPGVAIALKGLGRIVPFIGAGILAFDGFAAYKTLTDPAASSKRKWLVGLRFGTNAVGTALSFIPGWGMLAGIPASMASMGFDFWIKAMNAKHEA